MTTAKKYDAAFKDQCVQRYLAGGQTLTALSQEAHIQSDTLSRWVKAYQKTHPSAASSQPQKTEGATPKPAPKKMRPSAAPSQSKKNAPEVKSSEVEALRKALKIALEERDVLRRALRIVSASEN